MYRPSPPLPTYAASIAVETTCTVAPRNPPISSGMPSGISTRARICASVMPCARAASTVAGSAASTAE